VKGGKMYKQIIDRITKEVVLRQSRKQIQEIIDKKITGGRLYRGLYPAGLIGNKNDLTKLRIVIFVGQKPEERLISFAHEILHILYFVPELPVFTKQLRVLSEEAFCFLEDTIEDLSIRTVKAQEGFWREQFEKVFGFSVDTTPIDIK
jgi:hypothetical protein